jgi:hypothetical protein
MAFLAEKEKIQKSFDCLAATPELQNSGIQDSIIARRRVEMMPALAKMEKTGNCFRATFEFEDSEMWGRFARSRTF